jgi:predicted dithiol-disulfide oxidoreductase (DUF899 family)
MSSKENFENGSLISHPPIVSREEWQRARDQLLVKEKAATRARDALAAERRRLPMFQIEKNYLFEGAEGKSSLLDLFVGRRQLIVYHFMFAPDVEGWPSAGCPGCSMVVDHLGPVEHLHARNTSLVLISRAPLANLESYKRRMGWSVPWFSSAGTDFNDDFGLTTPEGETFGLSVFLRKGDAVFQTYFTNARGVEVVVSSFVLLDLTPFGRQEQWEDSPAGWPQTPPYEWWRRLDEMKLVVLRHLCNRSFRRAAATRRACFKVPATPTLQPISRSASKQEVLFWRWFILWIFPGGCPRLT